MLLYKNCFDTWVSDIQQKLIWASYQHSVCTQISSRHHPVKKHTIRWVTTVISCNGPRAQQLGFLGHFITFIMSTHDTVGPGDGSSRIQYLTKAAHNNEDILRHQTARGGGSAGREAGRPKTAGLLVTLGVSTSYYSSVFAWSLNDTDDSTHLTCVFLFHFIF